MRALQSLVLLVLVLAVLVLRDGGDLAQVRPASTGANDVDRSAAELTGGEIQASRTSLAEVEVPVGEVSEPPAPCGTVEFLVRETTSGRPVRSPIVLWRLGLPEDERRTAGDEIVEPALLVPEGGLRHEELAHGRYRAIVFRSALSAEDGPEFLHRGAYTRVDLPLVPPARVPLRVQLYDDLGRRVHGVHRIVRYSEESSHHPDTPEWATPRRPHDKLADAVVVEEPLEEEGEFEEYWEQSISDDDDWDWIEDDGSGFELGPVQEPRKSWSSAKGYGFLLEGARAEGHLRAFSSSALTFVGVLPDPRPFREAIEARDVDLDLAEHVTVLGELFPTSSPDSAWRRASIQVRIDVPGYHTIEYSERPGKPTPRTIQPRRKGE